MRVAPTSPSALCTRTSRHRPSLARLVVFAALALPAVAHAVPGDELWNARWSRPGADKQVTATTEFAGQLVVGGDFEFIGSVAARRVAIFNGTTWSPLGEGFNDDVTALAVYNNELYAGGSFSASGATPLLGLARWNGSAWVAVGGGVEGAVYALTVFNGSLVVAGSFSEVAGATPAGSIASWNGTTWSTLSGGVHSGVVNATVVFGGSLYVGGFFDLAGPTGAANIARWNGTTWSALGIGLRDAKGDASEAVAEHLHVWNSRVVVTGTFEQAGGQAFSNFATYNGTTWATLGSPTFFSNGAFAIGDYATSLLVIDDFGTTYRWNGAAWLSFTGNAYAFTMGHYGSDLIYGGFFDQVGGVQAEKLARYNGTTWSALATGDGASPGVQMLLERNGSLVAAGSGSRYGTVSPSLVAGWNGTTWSGFGTGIAPGFGRLVSSLADLGGDLVAGGSFPQAGGNAVNNIARWNGSAWSAMGATLAGTEVMKVIRGTLYAYGTIGAQTAVIRWNGASWVGIGNVNDIVWDLDEYQGKLIAAGTFSTIGGAAVRGLASWDSLSGTWSAIGASALNNSVFALAVDGNNLYIGGTFTTVGGGATPRTALWNGATWSALGTSVNNRVFDMVLHNNELFVTGEFITAGGNPANYIARWNGTTWNAMGSGLNARGFCLGVYGGDLFVGGDFTIAGGKYSCGIASWSDPGAVAVEPTLVSPIGLAFAAAPSPFEHATTLSWAMTEPAHVRLHVFDLSGRRVATLLDEHRPAGRHSATWNGRDTNGRAMAAGVYLSRIEVGARSETRRLVRVQ